MPSDKKIELDERYPSPLCMLSRGRVSPNLYSLQISPRQTRLYRNGIPLLFHRQMWAGAADQQCVPAFYFTGSPEGESHTRTPIARARELRRPIVNQPPAARRRDSFVHTSIIVPRARSAPTLRATRSAASHTSHTPRRCSMLTAILSYHSLTALWPTAPPPAHHRLRATSELVQHGVTTPHV